MSAPLDRGYSGLPVLLPGGAGFLGSRLALRLCQAGAAVTVVDPLDPHCGGNPFNLHPCRDRLQLYVEPIEKFVEDRDLGHYRIIFHCAGLADHFLGFEDPALDYRINCASGLAVLRALERRGAETRLLSLGARSQYGRPRTAGKLDERTPLEPLDVQSIHKTALESFHRLYCARGVDAVFVRLTNTYGPGQRMRGDHIGFVGELLRGALDGEELVIFGHLDRVKDLLYIDDVVEALLRLGLAPEARGVYNLGGSPCKIRHILAALERGLGRISYRLEPFPEAVRCLDTGDAVLDTSALTEICGWRPAVDINHGIGQSLAYYREHRAEYWPL